jgi:hypothetical protein
MISNPDGMNMPSGRSSFKMSAKTKLDWGKILTHEEIIDAEFELMLFFYFVVFLL